MLADAASFVHGTESNMVRNRTWYGIERGTESNWYGIEIGWIERGWEMKLSEFLRIQAHRRQGFQSASGGSCFMPEGGGSAAVLGWRRFQNVSLLKAAQPNCSQRMTAIASHKAQNSISSR